MKSLTLNLCYRNEKAGSVFLLVVLALTVMRNTTFASVTLVTAGKANAVIIIPREPTAVARYAAEELVYHVKKATRVTLPVVTEGDQAHQLTACVHLGPTDAAGKAGLDAAILTPDSSTLRSVKNSLYIIGRDSDGAPLSPDTWAGTLFGVYQLLEDYLGVRWLWPGDLGEHIPAAKNLIIPDINKTVAPRLLIRRLRSTLRQWPEIEAEDTFSPEAWAKVRADEAKWLRRHRMGHSRKMRWGHAFTGWWDKYGKEHPDWFNLLEDGQRRPQGRDGASASMCVSNPGFHRQIVQNWLEECVASADNKPNINCCENDVFGRCQCEGCKAWDVERPDAASYPPRFSNYGIVSDRYARFWRTVQELAAKHVPDVIVTGYAYVNYAPPPLREKLNDQVWIGLVPDTFFPRTEAEHNQCLDMWRGWAKTGCRLFLRPNYTLEGYCMPFNYVHQFADEFAHHARNGMIATDFDSLTAMWATQGPQQYLFARWQSCLDKPVDAVLAEYYSGFGSASAQVKAYFDYWEDFTMQNRDRFRDIGKRLGGSWATYPRMAHECFPEEAFARGEALLKEAQRAAKGNAITEARIAFLQKGLEHARKCTAASRARMNDDFVTSQHAIAELRDYRKQIEKENVVNLAYCAWLETRAFRKAPRPVVYQGQSLIPVADKVEQVDLKPVSLRGLFGFVVLLKEERNIQAHITAKRIGQNNESVRWSLLGPDRKQLAKGAVELGKSEDIVVAVPTEGMYNLILDTGRNAAQVVMRNSHVAILGNTLSLIGQSGPMYFYVPQGLKTFKITLQSPAPGETAKITVLRPDGVEAAAGSTGEKDEVIFTIPVPEGQDGNAWSVIPSSGGPGVWEDYIITLGSELPPYWAWAADRVLVPRK